MNMVYRGEEEKGDTKITQNTSTKSLIHISALLHAFKAGYKLVDKYLCVHLREGNPTILFIDMMDREVALTEKKCCSIRALQPIIIINTWPCKSLLNYR